MIEVFAMLMVGLLFAVLVHDLFFSDKI